MSKMRLLIVDDEEGILEVCEDTLRKLEEVEIILEKDSLRAAERLSAEYFDLLIVDIRMPGLNGLDLLRCARECDPELLVLMLTAFPTIETAIESMKIGASDYVTKPFLPEDLLATVHRLLEGKRLKQENRLLARHIQRSYIFEDIVGESPALQAVLDTVERVAQTDADVLIMGETGTGKELVARSIHNRSRRKSARFVPQDCGAIPDNLIESELFGYERGAFTGAYGKNIGLLEYANGGTFFMDEVTELPLSMQSALLRVLQERKIRRVGGKEEIDLDVRFIAATNRDLQAEVREKRFREDLFYRINVVQIDVPPLRRRGNDIRLLTVHFISRYAKEMGSQVEGIDSETEEILSHYSWPGNIRELQNVIRRAITLTQHRLLTVDDLPDELIIKAGENSEQSVSGYFQLRTQRLAAFEKEYFIMLLEKHGGDVSAATKEAQLPRGTLYRLMKKHNLRAQDFRRGDNYIV